MRPYSRSTHHLPFANNILGFRHFTSQLVLAAGMTVPAFTSADTAAAVENQCTEADGSTTAILAQTPRGQGISQSRWQEVQARCSIVVAGAKTRRCYWCDCQIKARSAQDRAYCQQQDAHWRCARYEDGLLQPQYRVTRCNNVQHCGTHAPGTLPGIAIAKSVGNANLIAYSISRQARLLVHAEWQLWSLTT